MERSILNADLTDDVSPHPVFDSIIVRASHLADDINRKIVTYSKEKYRSVELTIMQGPSQDTLIVLFMAQERSPAEQAELDLAKIGRALVMRSDPDWDAHQIVNEDIEKVIREGSPFHAALVGQFVADVMRAAGERIRAGRSSVVAD